MVDRSVTDTLDRLIADIDQAAPCLILPSGQSLSYGELSVWAGKLAGGLTALGLEGQPILVWLPNVPEWVALLLACARIGSPAIAVNARFRTHELELLLRVTGARSIVTTNWLGKVSSKEVVGTLASDVLASIDHIFLTDAAVDSDWPVPTQAVSQLARHGVPVATGGASDDPIIVFTTSGTTNAPKLVLHRQAGVVEHARAIGEKMGFTQPDTMLLQLAPFCGAFGFSQLIGALAAGAPSVVPPYFDGAEATRLAREHRVTNIFGTDDMLARMLVATTADDPFPDLRFFGHANFNPELRDIGARAEARRMTVRGLFGMSETLALFAIQPADAPLERRQLSGGIPIAGKARVRDTITGAFLSDDEVGELELIGPGLMSEYLGNEAATVAAFTDDGYLRTGDLATLTGDGGFLHVGRMGDAMRLSGFLVDPLEIEQVLLEDPSLRAAQAVDVVTPAGRRPVAFVIAANGSSPDEAALIAHCRAVLAPFKTPIRVFEVDSFPTTEGPNGIKVQRHQLRARAQAILDDAI